MEKHLIWDVPTRLFHWLLAISIAAQWVTAELFDDAMQWHFYIGYFTLGLIIFRVVWGLVGTTYARFSSFVFSPSSIIGYAKRLLDRNSPVHAGHNPIGGLMVFAMLFIIGAQAVSGLFLTDDVFLDGPYRHVVSESVQDLMNTIHHSGFTVIKVLVALHILAVVFYVKFKKQAIASAMVHGKKDTNAPAISSSKWLAAAIVFALSAGITYYVVEVAPPEQEVEDFFY